MKLIASVVVYNEKPIVLQRLIDDFLSINFEKKLFIIDNSPKNTLEEFCSAYNNVIYIFNNNNLGFGKAHNISLRYIDDSDIYLVLNPDIYFQSSQMEGFLKWFMDSSDIVLAIPKILNIDGTTQHVAREIPTPISLLKRKFHIEKGEINIADNSIVEIPFAHGCFMAFKGQVFKKLDGFDERYFMYMEDIDIWIRAKRYGKTVINTNFSIYHEHRKGSSRSIKLFFIHLLSAIKFFIDQ